jgi:hypothetical protein
MSVSLTEAAVLNRTKTVTRRLGWRTLEPGDRLTLCRKVMGRKRPDGTVEPLVRLAEVEVAHVWRERLDSIDTYDVGREGFPDMDAAEFVAFFCKHMSCGPEDYVTRIEWRYLDDDRSSEKTAPVDLMAALRASLERFKAARTDRSTP